MKEDTMDVFTEEDNDFLKRVINHQLTKAEEDEIDRELDKIMVYDDTPLEQLSEKYQCFVHIDTFNTKR